MSVFHGDISPAFRYNLFLLLRQAQDDSKKSIFTAIGFRERSVEGLGKAAGLYKS